MVLAAVSCLLCPTFWCKYNSVFVQKSVHFITCSTEGQERQYKHCIYQGFRGRSRIITITHKVMERKHWYGYCRLYKNSKLGQLYTLHKFVGKSEARKAFDEGSSAQGFVSSRRTVVEHVCGERWTREWCATRQQQYKINNIQMKYYPVYMIHPLESWYPTTSVLKPFLVSAMIFLLPYIFLLLKTLWNRFMHTLLPPFSCTSSSLPSPGSSAERKCLKA